MKTLVILGYGNQGRPWALNLRDSGWTIKVWNRPGRSLEKARAEGFQILSDHELTLCSDPMAVLLPDEVMPTVFKQFFQSPRSRDFIFAHGYSVVFKTLPIISSDGIFLMAPKGIGEKLRSEFVAGRGVLGASAIEQDPRSTGQNLLKALSEGLGLTRVGVVQCSFEQECLGDLISEQAVLCGILPRLVAETVDFMVGKGIPLELARYECINELKLIADMMVDRGVAGMMEKISTTARVGGMLAAQERVPSDFYHKLLDNLWADLKNGNFVQALNQQQKSGHKLSHDQLKSLRGLAHENVAGVDL